jgi:hypothetical protein
VYTDLADSVRSGYRVGVLRRGVAAGGARASAR